MLFRSLSVLDSNAKVEEIARMLGGVKITEQSRAHAEEMLAANSGVNKSNEGVVSRGV